VKVSKMVLGAMLMAALPLCGLADDTYLYWLIDQSAQAKPFTFYAAGMVDAAGNYYVEKDGKTEIVTAEPGGTRTAEQAMNINGGTSFVIELYDNNWDVVAWSDWMNFSDLGKYIGGAALKPADTLEVGHFSTIPEPTGGLLMLLGLAVLGLKRKRG